MRIRIYFLSIIFIITFFPQAAFSDSNEQDHDQSEVMSIDERGVSPSNLTLSKRGSSVFFLNSLRSDSFKLEIDYGKKVAHCASSEMEMSDDGIFASLNSVSSGEFLSVCFPKTGQYPVKILFENGKVSKALVLVE